MKKGQSLRIFWLFTTAVFLLIVIALLFKVYTVVAKSIFDGQHRFTILEKGNPTRVYSFAPDTKTISLLQLAKQKKESRENTLPIPIDATIVNKQPTYAVDGGIVGAFPKGPIDEYLKYLFFHYTEIQTEMTPLDLFRLWLFARSVDANDIRSEIAHVNISDKLLSKLFSDSSLIQEEKSIQVINGTGISGMGNEFARKLTNSGGNVVSVITARDSVEKTTIQYYGQPSYTTAKIEKITEKQATVSKKQTISDIIITLGKDTLK